MVVGYSFPAAREGLMRARVSARAEFLVTVSLLLVDGRDCVYASWHWKNERSVVKSWAAGVKKRRIGVRIRLVASTNIDLECN